MFERQRKFISRPRVEFRGRFKTAGKKQMTTTQLENTGYKNVRVAGLGRIFKPRWKRKDGSFYESPNWWIAYYYRGKEIRESSSSTNDREAKRVLKRKVTATVSGKLIPREDKLSFEDMARDLENDYTVNGRKTLADLPYRVGHLRQFFGMDRAIDITTDRGRAYQRNRLEEGAAPATINRELAALRRMLSLAFNAGKLSHLPRVEMLEENNVRESFLEHDTFMTLLGNLPEHLRDLVEFEYLSGWRQSAAKKLQWADVDMQSHTARLRSANSKNRTTWILPLTGKLLEVLERRKNDRRLDCPYVFHRNGKQIKDFRGSWKTACKNSGLVAGRAGVTPHDLRRCAARNLSRAGVPEQTAMKITGHKSTSMYRRYRIVDERDLREAAETLNAYLQRQPKASVVVPLKKASEKRKFGQYTLTLHKFRVLTVQTG
jgi:integrase